MRAFNIAQHTSERPWQATRPRRRKALISLTPLIDVVFILLVFFLLASNFQDWRTISLNPTPPTGHSTASMEGALLVEVRPDGVRLSAEPVSLNRLGSRVARYTATRPDIRVLVKPTNGVRLQETIRVLDVLSAAGVDHLSLTH